MEFPADFRVLIGNVLHVDFGRDVPAVSSRRLPARGTPELTFRAPEF
jgi:hypothetical protein